jgi:hypothetical protein
MATSPTNASDIKYAVMFASLQKIRHCRALSGNPSEKCILQRLMDARIIPDQVGDRRPGVTKIESARSGSNMRQIAFAIISGANPIPSRAIGMADRRGGAARGHGAFHAARRHVRACRLMLSWFGRQLVCDAGQQCMGGCGVKQCGCRPIRKNPIEKARGGFPAQAQFLR